MSLRFGYTATPDAKGVAVKLENIAESLDKNRIKTVMRAAQFAGKAIAKKGHERFKETTGSLPRSFLTPTPLSNTSNEASAGALSTLRHSRIQDIGGTIRPKTKQYLAVPLTPTAKKRWPRDWGDSLHLIRSKANNLLLVEVGSKGKKFTVHYVLKREVKIPGTRYIQDAAADSKKEINEILVEGMQQSVDEAT